jgi:hypothetical protein
MGSPDNEGATSGDGEVDRTIKIKKIINLDFLYFIVYCYGKIVFPVIGNELGGER